MTLKRINGARNSLIIFQLQLVFLFAGNRNTAATNTQTNESVPGETDESVLPAPREPPPPPARRDGRSGHTAHQVASGGPDLTGGCDLNFPSRRGRGR